jgi:hypothetical protein
MWLRNYPAMRERAAASLLALTLLAACSDEGEEPDVDGDESPAEAGAPTDNEGDDGAPAQDAAKPNKPAERDGGRPAIDGGRPSVRDASLDGGFRDGASASDAGTGSVPSEDDGGAVASRDASGQQPSVDAAPGPSGPSDFSQRGPYQVVTEKNVGRDFRNSNVRDETATCRAFVGGVMLPGEGNVDEELTNYPADMDRQLYTLFRPAQLEAGKTYPAITWGNGTCAQPLLYSEILEHLASWGVIVIASNATSVGSGREMLRGIDFLLKENETEGSALFGKIDTTRFGASGHSQGSQGTVAAGADARIKVTVPIQGASAAGVRALKGPTFLIAGEKDTLVTPSSVQSAFNAATVPAVYGLSVGQDHLMPGRNPAPILEGVTGWFRIHLFADDTARALFYGASCELCSDPLWKITQKNL